MNLRTILFSQYPARFLLAVLFDVVNVRNLLRALRVARRATA